MMAADAGGSDMVACRGNRGKAARAVPKRMIRAYRPAEVPLAFFRPMLVTDASGNLEITYTVPDANTDMGV